jgi:hypothetical protein
MAKDVMFHAAVTVVPRTNGVALIGDKDIELCQFAAEIPAKRMPLKESHARRAFDEMAEACIKRMRKAGMIRD